jgi:hypothetical protein
MIGYAFGGVKVKDAISVAVTVNVDKAARGVLLRWFS